jgi:3-deoxy-D-manno-octulosonic-acid transferase
VNPLLRAGYEGTARLACLLARLAPASSHKLVATFAARRGVVGRYQSFARDHARGLLWMHAPSVGEGLQARPILDLMRRRRADTQLAYSFFSPSALAFARSLDVDFQDVLPFDDTASMRAATAALAPTALVFSKLDVWPTLAREARRRGTRLGLVSATLAASSSRRSRLAGALLRDAYGHLDRVGAVSTEDADRLVSLGVPARRVTVTGDTRFDQVWARAGRVDREGPILAALRSTRPTLVAGSTWPADESALLPAWAAVAGRHRDVRLVIAPHEPTAAHLAPIESWAASSGLRVSRLGGEGAAEADVVLVDRLGVLGDLYDLAGIAFVGGGFHDAGLHSVLEPAAFGAPVLFGPRHEASRDARLLLDADGALAVPSSSAIESALESWARGDTQWRTAGRRARAAVHAGLGAAERSFALVTELLDG